MEAARRRRARVSQYACRVILVFHVLWILALLLALAIVLHPLHQRLERSLRLIDRRLNREKPGQARWQRTATEHHDRGKQQTAQQTDARVSPVKAAAERTQSTSPAETYRWSPIFPVVEALSLHSTSDDTTAVIDAAETELAIEFDVFSAEHLSRQFLLVYREDFAATHPHANITRAILKAHRPYLQHVTSFSALPGCLVTVNLAGVDDDGLIHSRTREQFLSDLVDSIRAHEAVAFVSPNQPLGLDAIASQAVYSDAYVSPGVRRILAATRSTANRAADVAVAILDTGVDLMNENLNVRSGINCIHRVARGAHVRRGTHDFSFTAGDSAAKDPAESSDDDDRSSADSLDNFSFDDYPAQDDNNHGTHVAGIIGSRNQPNGIIGVAPGTLLYSVKILDSFGRGSFAHLVCGLDWLANNAQRLNIKAGSMSLAGVGSNDNACGERNSDALHRAICQVIRAGVSLVAAAGNTASDLSKIVPAAYPEVLTVTAMGGQAKTASRNAKNWIVNLLELIRTMLSFTSTDSDGVPGAMGEPLTCAGSESDDHVASFSNYALLPADPRAMREFPNANAKEGERGGAYVTEDSWTNHSLPITSHLLAAPGVCILSTVVHNQFALFSGTSQACPYVVGVLALEYGSGGVDGPCSSLPPQQCMLHLVARSQSYADRMGMGYEFLPWARSERGGDQGTANLTISLEIGHNQTVPVRARRYYGPLVVGRLS